MIIVPGLIIRQLVCVLANGRVQSRHRCNFRSRYTHVSRHNDNHDDLQIDDLFCVWICASLVSHLSSTGLVGAPFSQSVPLYPHHQIAKSALQLISITTHGVRRLIFQSRTTLPLVGAFSVGLLPRPIQMAPRQTEKPYFEQTWDFFLSGFLAAFVQLFVGLKLVNLKVWSKFRSHGATSALTRGHRAKRNAFHDCFFEEDERKKL